MAGTSAYAQVTSVTGSAGTTVSLNSSVPSTTVLPGEGTTPAGASGAHYNSFVNITPSLVTFESANAGSAGAFVNASSFSTVNIGVHNATNADVIFNSTITGAGLGFYLADTSTNCLFTGCSPIPTSSPLTFADLPGVRSGSANRAKVGFEFDVSLQGSDTSLYHLDGSLILTANVDGVFVTDNLGVNCAFMDDCTSRGPRGNLNNFRLTSPTTSDSALGFAWDATPISFDLGTATDFSLVYTTRVFSLAGSSCITDSTVCLVAYSGFGDPVGRGGGVDSILSAGLPSFGASFLGTNLSSLATTDPGLSFAPAVFGTPTFVNGVLGFTAAPVPEPASWITMILGFGMLGATLRRRRTFAAI